MTAQAIQGSQARLANPERSCGGRHMRGGRQKMPNQAERNGREEGPARTKVALPWCSFGPHTLHDGRAPQVLISKTKENGFINLMNYRHPYGHWQQKWQYMSIFRKNQVLYYIPTYQKYIAANFRSFSVAAAGGAAPAQFGETALPHVRPKSALSYLVFEQKRVSSQLITAPKTLTANRWLQNCLPRMMIYLFSNPLSEVYFFV